VSELKKMEILSFGDLIEKGKYSLFSRHNKVVNFRGSKGLVSFVLPEIGAGPFNLILNVLPKVGFKIEVGKEGVLVDGDLLRVETKSVYNSHLPFLNISEKEFMGRLFFVKKIFLEKSHPLSCAFFFDRTREKNFKSSFERCMLLHFKKAFHLLKNGDFHGFLRNVRGAGLGFTPSGDDLISGFITFVLFAERNFKRSWRFKKIFCLRASGTNPISSAAIEAAKKGRCDERFKSLLLFLKERTFGEDIENKVLGCLARGNTSGADFISGFLLASEFV